MGWGFGRWSGSNVENTEGVTEGQAQDIPKRETRGTSGKGEWISSGAGGLGREDRLGQPVPPSPAPLHPLPPRHLAVKSPGKEGLRLSS